MGKKAIAEEKLSLIEFLYKDSDFISSLYSQCFGGDLTGVQQIEGISEELAVDANMNIKVVGERYRFRYFKKS
ncbi:hypothetical protein UMC2_05041 [[Clostridium] sordellii]|uniref:hypothetical protein n=1 Tax=Paraclostridium sordellii TaxID=1505 RepID=UPI000542397F|nr:hypothetical protein [Paeniclostridium sordellii]CEK33254.1 hypothetical protein UMC2_05041 [[Clostridium] sordellii] [Paeniclostridium sordellii]